MSQPSPSTPPASRWVSAAVPVVAALALLIGVVLLLIPEPQLTVGWFSYEPLPETILNPYASSAPSARVIASFALAAVGALTLAFYGGWAFARRRLTR